MKKFRENGFVTVSSDGQIELTRQGQFIAEKTFEKHTVLAEALMLIGVDEDTAYEDSCRLEHCISDVSFEAIKAFIQESKTK